MESFRVGSIAWSTRYFQSGSFSRKSFEIAEIAAKAVLDEALDAYAADQWDIAYGSAMTLVFFVFVLLLSLGQRKLIRSLER
jgi:exopolyphosphatase/guanosine-5'-triphosphate,3'-diphosphate pyrophosphatase